MRGISCVASYFPQIIFECELSKGDEKRILFRRCGSVATLSERKISGERKRRRISALEAITFSLFSQIYSRIFSKTMTKVSSGPESGARDAIAPGPARSCRNGMPNRSDNCQIIGTSARRLIVHGGQKSRRFAMTRRTLESMGEPYQRRFGVRG